MPQESRTKLIVNYLPQNMTENELVSLFGRYGRIQSSRIVKDHKTGYSYGYGFIEYATESDCVCAIDALNGLPIESKRLKVSFARPPGQGLKDTNLYVTNLPRAYTEDDLDQLFGPFGAIVQKKMLFDRISGMPRGVAFVRYNTKDEADAAVNALNGQIVDGGSEPLQIKVAEEHGKQKAAYYAGMKLGMSIRGAGRPTLSRGRGIGMGRGTRFNPITASMRPAFPPPSYY